MLTLYAKQPAQVRASDRPAIDDLKDAMEGMLAPEMKEEILGTAEIREIFKISKVGSIAGCMVMDGKIVRNAKMRIIREGVVVFTGELLALKRFKDDVKEVAKGYDCGIQVKGYNDIEERDVIESYHEVAIKKKLKQNFQYFKNGNPDSSGFFVLQTYPIVNL